MNSRAVAKDGSYFEFDLIGGEKSFIGYISSEDKTAVNPRAMIKGSMNVLKTFRGTIAARDGLKRWGAVDPTFAGVVASYEWYNSVGRTIPLRVVDNKLQFESDIVSDGDPVWYDLYDESGVNPAASLTRFIFAPYWVQDENKDTLVMVRGDANMLHWSGGYALLDSTGSQSGVITAINIGAAGTGYAQGDIVTVSGGDGNATMEILSVTGGSVTAIGIVNPGTGYTTGNNQATTGGSGSGFQIDITAGTAYTITKQGTTTWREDGFTTVNMLQTPKTIAINGNIYTYSGGEETTTLVGVQSNPSGETQGSMISQVVVVTANTPAEDYTNDFIVAVTNQILVGSYNASILYLSANTDLGNEGNTARPGFLDFVAVGDRVFGSPDFIVLDNPPTGAAVKGGSAYVFAGTSDYYKITPNYIPPISYDTASGTQYIVTTREKTSGPAFSAAQAQEFIDNWGDDVVYLDQKNQLRMLGTYRNIVTQKNPMHSLAVHDELEVVDFTGGALRAIDTRVYITAPNLGVHYLYEIREALDLSGNIIGEKFWHPPQVSGISRFAVIDSVVYGHSNQNPMIYQVYDTNQWHDDGPDDEPLPYTCVMRMAYRSHSRRQGLIDFNMVYYEGYATQGTNLMSYILYDYNGSTSIQNPPITQADDQAYFFAGTSPFNLGDAIIGENPLGIGVVPDYTAQELLPKFRAITDINPINCFEYSLEVYSDELDSRWEILFLGTNAKESQTLPTFIRK
jgi:hypothetical protein